MRTLWLVLVALTGCTSNELCRGIPVGARVDGFKRFAFTSTSEPIYRGMLSPSTSPQFDPLRSRLTWDVGPTDDAMCCATKQFGEPLSWCTQQQLECTDPSMQRLKLYLLADPWSDTSRQPDDAETCFVVARDDVIIAILHRYWS